jgi:hypothetical protein
MSGNTQRRIVFLTFVLLAFSGCRYGTSKKSVSEPGTELGSPVRVSLEDGTAAEPAIASSPDGGVYVAWVNHDQTGKADVMIARLSSDGQMESAPVRVNSQPGIATAWRGDPPTVAVAPDRTVFVGWTAKPDSASGHATDIYLSASRDNCRTFAEPVKVNDDTRPAVHGMHSLAIGKDGRIYVAWLDERNISPEPAMDEKTNQRTSGHHMESNREVFIASSTDGGHAFSPNQRVATNVCPCCKTALAVDNDGRVYLSWRQVLPGDFRHIAVASSIDQARSFSEMKIVSDDQWMLAGCPVSGPSLALSADGTLRVLWYSAGKNGETGLYFSDSKDHAGTFGPRVLVARGETFGSPVLLNDGNHLNAVWGAIGAKVMTERLAANDAEQAEALQIAEGDLPAAAAISRNLFVAYIRKSDQHQAVWITSIKRDQKSD